jgi:hypothetical protein
VLLCGLIHDVLLAGWLVAARYPEAAVAPF